MIQDSPKKPYVSETILLYYDTKSVTDIINNVNMAFFRERNMKTRLNKLSISLKNNCQTP